ncbi:hypothetical protein J6590_051951 [Homalodisca vitripennis]|nr:hypothetical protein J6590_051951 [Homalodisca vitripennis]
MPARCAALRAACSFRKKINSSSSKFEAQITSVPLITNRKEKGPNIPESRPSVVTAQDARQEYEITITRDISTSK